MQNFQKLVMIRCLYVNIIKFFIVKWLKIITLLSRGRRCERWYQNCLRNIWITRLKIWSIFACVHCQFCKVTFILMTRFCLRKKKSLPILQFLDKVWSWSRLGDLWRLCPDFFWNWFLVCKLLTSRIIKVMVSSA